jgi:1,4-alpha-glucan branching enzyme
MKKIISFCLWAILFAFDLNAQVTCTPVFPGPDDNVTITFNANEGNKGLLGFTGDIYAHTGVITDKSTSPSDWKFVKFGWTVNDPSCKLTAQGNGIYTLSFNNIRAFYGVPSTDKILKMNFVFRSPDGNKQGKTADNGDIFYDVVSDASLLVTRIVAPSAQNFLVDKNATVSVKAAASLASTLTLTDNGVVVTTLTNAKDLNTTITANTEGVHLVKFKAVSGAKTDSSSFSYVVVPPPTVANPPAGFELGATVNSVADSVTLLFQAPGKSNVFVLGSFNDYQLDNKYLMNKSVDGSTFWLKLGGLTKGQTYTYQYLVDGTIKVADPLSTLILDPNDDKFISATVFPNMPAYPTGKTTGIVSVLQPGKAPYVWKNTNFQRPAKRDLVIYELLMRDFVATHDYQTIIDTLPYFKRLGINAIEFMPVNEFDGNESWGYNPDFHMALDKYYGSPDKFKALIDKCHENGIAVILDVVFNHATGQSPLIRLFQDGFDAAADNPWANKTARHEFNVFSDLNHESPYTKAYVNRCLKFWLEEYKIDGYRFDLSKGFTQKNTLGNSGAMAQYDQSRIDILTEYHNTAQAASPGAYTILEHFADGSEETALAEKGMMLWSNGTYDYNEVTMGYNFNIAYGSGKRRGWNDAKHDSHVSYMESHDEERLMFKNLKYGNAAGNYSVKELYTALKRQELASAFFYTIPGPRMLWQFGEMGYDYNIQYPSLDNKEGEKDRLTKKPIRWDYLNDWGRKRLFDVTRNILHLRNTQSVFRTLNYDANELADKANPIKAFHLQDANLSITILGNMGVTAADVTPVFQNTGKWYNYLTNDSTTVTDVNAKIRLLPGEYRIMTSKKLPTPPAGYFNYSVSTKEFANEVNEFDIYPNPSVSGSTFIGYNIRNTATVQWDVFNLTGQRVAGSNPVKLQAGSYQDVLSASLPTGQYMIRLTVNGATESKKLIISQ